MRYKNISFAIFFFVKEVNSLANCCDECCYDYFGYCTEKYKRVIEDEDNTIKNDFQAYVNNAINTSAKYEPQTKVLRQFINHYKKSKRMLPKHLEPFLDVLLKIPIANEELVKFMKMKLDWENKKKDLQYDETDNIEVKKEIPKNEADNKSVEKYILTTDTNIINKDLIRTFPKIQGFNDPNTQKIFKKIVYNFIGQLHKSGNNVGYCQGMNSYAGFFLLLCKQEDPSGKLAFELLYLFMTKKWLVNDYLKGDVVIEATKNQPERIERFKNRDYSILSFFEEGFLVVRLFSQNIINSLNKTFTLNSNFIFPLREMFLLQSFIGLNVFHEKLNLLFLLNRVFFFILLFENYKIFLDILKYWCSIPCEKLKKIEKFEEINNFLKENFPQIIFNRYSNNF